tara:strand:+ start:15375 stop:16028 length:654 start_codon:yes stop_codon:yes gene_type:complete
MRPLDLADDELDDYMLEEISLDEFKGFMETREYKKNSMPRKPEKFLELRMYGLVPYNISKIQQGIQYDHAKDNYSLVHGDDAQYQIFLREWLTAIVLNGGTSNEGHMVRHGFQDIMYKGTMQQHLEDLENNDIKYGAFYEPDLNSMLSAIVFLVDERVFDTKAYPDFQPPILPEDPTPEDFNKWSSDNENQYANWLEKIGGNKNLFLREFLKGKRLA